MTISGGQRPPQSKLGRTVMWIIFGVAGVMLVIAIVLFIKSGAPLF